ncbi:MAG: transport system permease protein, partial [Oscillospiraceae bacterium]|nr:transport system permease protein [Oscillospiraceae bacterium]
DTMFNSLGYVLLGILSFFFVFIISGISFVRERSSGTLERLMLTPISRLSVVAGYTVGFGIFAAIQSILIILYTKYALGITFEGPLLLAILIMILLAFTAVSMGALVSIFANSEFQVMQFIPVIIIPQMFFSGLIPIDTLPFGLGKLAYIMPVYYGCTALENVMIKGFGIEQIWQYLLILLAFILVLFIINTLALKKYRKI